MVVRVNTAGISGIEGMRVVCECDLSPGIARFDIVGLPDASVKESQDRVRSAVKNSGFDYPIWPRPTSKKRGLFTTLRFWWA